MDIVDQLKASAIEGLHQAEDLLMPAAAEIERLRIENVDLREALDLLVVYWDEWMDNDDDVLALSLEEVVLIARDTLNKKTASDG